MQRKVAPAVITSLPRSSTKPDTIDKAMIRAIFLSIKKKAHFAALQKWYPKIAVCIYAFLFINFMHFSMHHMQQSMQHSTAMAIFLATGFLMFLHFFWMYLIMALIVLMMAMMRLPKAAVPQWYQAPCLKDQITVLFPILPLSLVKYHVDTANAKMICPSAIINSELQK